MYQIFLPLRGVSHYRERSDQEGIAFLSTAHYLIREQISCDNSLNFKQEASMLRTGDSASLTKTFTDEDVRNFAKISGDTNPIHLVDGFAARTRFKKRLVHGMLTAGLFSAVLGTRLPGPGSIYLSQSITFRAPVFINDRITATVTVTRIRGENPTLTLETVCRNQDGVVVLDGEAVLLVPGLV